MKINYPFKTHTSPHQIPESDFYDVANAAGIGSCPTVYRDFFM